MLNYTHICIYDIFIPLPYHRRLRRRLRHSLRITFPLPSVRFCIAVSTHSRLHSLGLNPGEFHFASLTHAPIISLSTFQTQRNHAYTFFSLVVSFLLVWCLVHANHSDDDEEKKCVKFFQTEFFSRPLVFRIGSNAPNIIISQMLVFLVWSWCRIWEVRKYNDTFVLFKTNSVRFRNTYLRTDGIHLTDMRQRASVEFVFRLPHGFYFAIGEVPMSAS